jgi:hypothetical protein
MESWLEAYRAATSAYPGFVHWDADWTLADWPSRALGVESYAHAHGIPFGIIDYGNHDDPSDASWVQNAAAHLITYLEAGGQPEAIIFQSWALHPQWLLPETDPSTFTSLIDRFFVTPPRQYTVSGTVPPGATSAVAGFRANTECDCTGSAAALSIYGASFTERDGVERVANGNLAQGWTDWGGFGSGALQLIPSDAGSGFMLQGAATASQTLGLNSVPFPVDSGGRFTLTFSARVEPSTTGYFTVVFLSASGELSRVRIPFGT